MALCCDGMDVYLHGYVDSDFASDVDSRRVPLVMSHIGKWSSESGVEAAKDSRIVFDGG